MKQVFMKSVAHQELQKHRDIGRLQVLEEYFYLYYNTCKMSGRLGGRLWLDALFENEIVVNRVELQLLKGKYKSGSKYVFGK